MEPEMLSTKITALHLAKLAYVYVRQSSLGQVLRHRESTDLQYQLVERAERLGWPRERIEIIDEDLGKSGASVTERTGFQHLIAEVSLGRVELVISFDASRLARNNRDWYQLLEVCSIFGTLLADHERVYDPTTYTDRLLLGLTGMMSEAELHQLRRRLQAGAWNKATRGELHQPLPVGQVRRPDGAVVLHPDEEVRTRIQLVFEKFAELQVAKAVLRYLLAADLQLPARPLCGPAPYEVVWQVARSSMVLAILKNPAYAGTFVYGRQTKDPTRHTPGHPCSGIVRRPIDEWPIVVHNVYPAYITWEQFMANQEQLAADQSRYDEQRPGAPKKGQALLQGILRCGRCGAQMRLQYSGSQGEFPVYTCVYALTEYAAPCCQEVRGLGLDAEVEQLLLEALTPDQLALAVSALEALEQEHTALKRQRELHLERSRYECQRAQRQYDAVEPENRLVARTLEQQWEAKLRAVEKAEQEFHAWEQQAQLQLSAADRADILKLGADLPKVWYAPSTTTAERKQIVRLLIKEVLVDQKRVPGTVWFQINWQTGAVSEHTYVRRVRAYADYANRERLQQRIRELHAEQRTDAEIAEMLNTEGFRTTKLGLFNNKTIWLFRKELNLPPIRPNGPHPLQWEDGTYSVEGAAQAVGVLTGAIHKWLRNGRLEGWHLYTGAPWHIGLTPDNILELRDYVQCVRRSKKGAV